MKTLLFVALGKDEVFSSWANFLDDPNLDIIVVNYDSTIAEENLPFRCKFFWQEAGRKHLLFKQALDNGHFSLETYDYYWLIDDDLIMSPADVNVFLGFLDFYRPEIAQPSIRGFTSHSITKTLPFSLARWTSFVEIQAPCFKRSALIKVLPYFEQTLTGGGMDLIFWSILDKPKKGLLIVDCTPAIHQRPTKTGVSKDAVQSRLYFEETYGRDPHKNFSVLIFRHFELRTRLLQWYLRLIGGSQHPTAQKIFGRKRLR